MSEVGWVHFVFCLVAIGAGAVVVLRPKGTRWHRTWGHLYVWSMLGVVVTALSIYDLTGGPGPFHLGALVALLTVSGGMYTVLRRRPKKSWMEAHAAWMSWSYVGLLAAAAAESLSRFVMPWAAGFLESESLWGVFWGSVALATFIVFAIGAWLVRTRLPGALERTPEAIRRERSELRTRPPPEAGEGSVSRPSGVKG